MTIFILIFALFVLKIEKDFSIKSQSQRYLSMLLSITLCLSYFVQSLIICASLSLSYMFSHTKNLLIVPEIVPAIHRQNKLWINYILFWFYAYKDIFVATLYQYIKELTQRYNFLDIIKITNNDKRKIVLQLNNINFNYL